MDLAEALVDVLGELATDPYGHLETVAPEIANAGYVRTIANVAGDVRRVRRLQQQLPPTPGQ